MTSSESNTMNRRSVFTAVSTRSLAHLRTGDAATTTAVQPTSNAAAHPPAVAVRPPPSMTVEQRRVAMLSLFDEAVRRDLARFHEQGHKQQQQQQQQNNSPSRGSRVQWWAALRGQLLAHLEPTLAANHTTTDVAEAELRLNAAIENLSSLGIWFDAPTLQLPDRSYTALTPYVVMEGTNFHSSSAAPPLVMLPDGQLYQWTVLVGLCAFSYSTYVAEARRASQMQVLQQLGSVAPTLFA